MENKTWGVKYGIKLKKERRWNRKGKAYGKSKVFQEIAALKIPSSVNINSASCN